MNNTTYFDKIDTIEKTYWLGFILADGCIIWNQQQGNYSLAIGLQPADACHLSALELDLGGTRSPQKERTSVRLNWYAKRFAQALINLGIPPRKSGLNISVPKIPKRFISHFWRGVFDGDGMLSTCKKKPGELTEYRFSLAGSPSVLSSFQEWAAQFGIRPQKIVVARNQNGDTKAFKFDMSGNRQIEAVTKAMYKNATRFLPRKHTLYQALVEQNAVVTPSYVRAYSS